MKERKANRHQMRHFTTFVKIASKYPYTRSESERYFWNPELDLNDYLQLWELSVKIRHVTEIRFKIKATDYCLTQIDKAMAKHESPTQYWCGLCSLMRDAGIYLRDKYRYSCGSEMKELLDSRLRKSGFNHKYGCVWTDGMKDDIIIDIQKFYAPRIKFLQDWRQELIDKLKEYEQ